MFRYSVGHGLVKGFLVTKFCVAMLESKANNEKKYFY